jgi:predicted O-methyltransferase YrrM
MSPDTDPTSIVARLHADPPRVHIIDGDADAGVGLPTDAECYGFLASAVGPGLRTLETGLGLSTVVFAAAGAIHTCVTWSQDEVVRLQEYCARTGVSLDGTTFAVGLSEDVLPSLPPTELDLVFIDGGHGFPVPIVDWFYSAGRLREGGLLVLDDLQLPAVAILADFLAGDERWVRVAGGPKWTALVRRAHGSLSEDWVDQLFHHYPPPLRPRQLTTRIARGLLRRLRDLVRR